MKRRFSYIPEHNEEHLVLYIGYLVDIVFIILRIVHYNNNILYYNILLLLYSTNKQYSYCSAVPSAIPRPDPSLFPSAAPSSNPSELLSDHPIRLPSSESSKYRVLRPVLSLVFIRALFLAVLRLWFLLVRIQAPQRVLKVVE